MSTHTKRRLVVCLFALALALPAETILLQALTTPDERTAADSWVQGLDSAELDAVADAIQAYPFAYRKAIMRALTPGERSVVWRDHIQTYLESHRDLDETAVIVLKTAIAVATPEMFGSPDAVARDQARVVADELVALIGREEAEVVLYRLGPADGTFVSREPIAHKLANYVRRMTVALAAEMTDCNCNTGFGCDGYTTHCADGTGCEPDTTWPACGWFWNEDCDGECRMGQVG